MDLRRHHAALSEAVEGLVPQVGVLEGELGGMEASDDEDVSWMAARLQRLDTLEAAGETVDPGERARLERSLAAHAAAARDRVALESDLTSAMAALLELSAAASRARRQLADPDQLRVSAPRLAEELDQKLAAMAAARRELAR